MSGNLLDGGEGIPIEQLILRPDSSFDPDDLLPADQPVSEVLEFDDGGPRSLGEALRDAAAGDRSTATAKQPRSLASRLANAGQGAYVAYLTGGPRDSRSARVGLVLSNRLTAQELTLQRVRSAQHYVRVLRRPLFLDAQRAEVVIPPFLPDHLEAAPAASICQPLSELRSYKHVVEIVNLFQDGSLNHSSLRALEQNWIPRTQHFL